MVPAAVVHSVSSRSGRDTGNVRLELSRQGDYAVRAMLALASADARGWRSVSRTSAEMAIPERFLPRIMRGLVEGGLIEARTGRTGGYRLARPPGEITLLDVLAVAEPGDEIPRCVLRGIPCGVDGRCAVHDTFDEARVAFRTRLARTSLADLTVDARR